MDCKFKNSERVLLKAENSPWKNAMKINYSCCVNCPHQTGMFWARLGIYGQAGKYSKYTVAMRRVTDQYSSHLLKTHHRLDVTAQFDPMWPCGDYFKTAWHHKSTAGIQTSSTYKPETFGLSGSDYLWTLPLNKLLYRPKPMFNLDHVIKILKDHRLWLFSEQ